MGITDDVDREIQSSAFWDEFWSVFASPFTLFADLLTPQDDDDDLDDLFTLEDDDLDDKSPITSGVYLARFRSRYGEGGSDTDIGSVTRAWSQAGDHLRRAFEQMERDYGEQIRNAKTKETERDADES